MNWATERAHEIVKPLKHLIHVKMTPKEFDALWDRVAAELQRVADECVAELWERVSREEYGHAKGAVTLDIEAIEAKFPKEAE